MKRRQFLQSLAALGAAPLVPSMGSGALALSRASTVAPVVNAQAYQWAEVIVRAHKTSSLAMLQRHLKVDVAAAKALQNQLIRNGVIGAQANAYGMYQATNPLFDGAFPKPSNLAETGRDLIKKVATDQAEGEVELEPEFEELVREIPISALYNEDDWTSHLAA